MAIDTAAKRASALGTFTFPFLRLAVPDGSVERTTELGLYMGVAAGAPSDPATSSGITGYIVSSVLSNIVTSIV